MRKTKWTAGEVADIALEGLADDRLYIVPQTDGQVMWRFQRALGERFYGVMGRAVTSDRLQRLLGLR